ncbi:GNAT family N-acetyltransferase [Lysinibacillus antri]|uniref:N-acetyltransferase n=1 Tax=Lysinibacillus antri TaxID=2498145 RepID=A0A432L751_9BACI|nr:GNAT family N-acetyltransferase [Lysinibacillus antri]RUL47279.1 N-acetyltransferase [Lysinibacillus antri]
MEITLELLNRDDFEKLYEFELENRAYFEEMVPSRGEDYYHLDTFIKNNNALLIEQAQGISYLYLIKDLNGVIVGRTNLVDIDKAQGSGHVGYRVGKAYTGKGIANNALALLLEKTYQLGIKQIFAKTTTHNIASQRVLEKNGFSHIQTEQEHWNGESFVQYRWNGGEM